MKKYTGLSWWGLTLAVLIGLMCALLLLACSNYGAYAENAPSPTVRNLYKVESDGMRISEAPLRMVILDIVTVDIDARKLNETGVVAAKVTFPFIPDEGIAGIVLFDGYHLAHGGWERTGENALTVTFKLEDVCCFDGTVGLYLILLGHNEG